MYLPLYLVGNDAGDVVPRGQSKLIIRHRLVRSARSATRNGGGMGICGSGVGRVRGYDIRRRRWLGGHIGCSSGGLGP